MNNVTRIQIFFYYCSVSGIRPTGRSSPIPVDAFFKVQKIDSVRCLEGRRSNTGFGQWRCGPELMANQERFESVKKSKDQPEMCL